MWRAPEQKVLAGVLLAGPYAEQRMGALRSGVRLFRRTPSLEGAARKPLRTAMRALEALPHPGGDSAVVRLLLFAGDHFVFPVDPGVQRLVTRLRGAAPDANVRRSMRAARIAVTGQLPRSLERWREAAVYLSHHAAATCTEADPHCSVCPLRSDCVFGTTADHNDQRRSF
jgi:endonuclease III